MSIKEHLKALLEEAVAPLAGTHWRKMFGCDAVFREGTIFALVWKTGRIGVKLPDPRAFSALSAIAGSEPWCAGTMAMSHWLLVPEAFHDEPETLVTWVQGAHALATPSSQSKTRPDAARKNAPKRRGKS